VAADLATGIISASAGLIGALIGGLVTVTVQRASIGVQRAQLQFDRDIANTVVAQRWDETRRALYSDYLASMSALRRELRAMLHDAVEGVPYDVDRVSRRLRELHGQASAAYNTVRLVASLPLDDCAVELLIDIDWYRERLLQHIDRGSLPPAQEIESIRDKYRRDAPAFVRQAQADLQL
jgi:hypothetical protein